MATDRDSGMKFLFIWALGLLTGFGAACFVQPHWNGSARVFHNINDGTALNHGQPSIEVTLPGGIAFSPSDGLRVFNPHWHYVRGCDGDFVFDGFSVEQGDPTPGNGLALIRCD
jgi:hypothetical protein